MTSPVSLTPGRSLTSRASESKAASMPSTLAGPLASPRRTDSHCGVVDLELFGLVCDLGELEEIRTWRAAAFPWLATTDQDFQRALEVQRLLMEQGVSPVPWPALVVAAVAERHGVTVLHCNGDFERIASVTGVRVEGVRMR